jgi:hypothetical protein
LKLEIKQMGNYVKFSSTRRTLKNAEVIEIKYRQPLTETIDQAQLENIGNGYYSVPGVLSGMSQIEGVSYQAPGDIAGMEAAFDSKGREVDILEFRQNTVRLNDEGFTQPIAAFGVEWLKPYKFILLSQNISKQDEKLLEMHRGDAVCAFPYHFDVAEGDIITALSGANTKKIVMKHKGPDIDDVITDFFVRNVTYLATDAREYKAGVDFLIVGSNKLHWICEDPPEAGANMSVTYLYLPTYRVFMFIPMTRTSEDQRMPKKVALKLFSGFNEAMGVNKNGQN